MQRLKNYAIQMVKFINEGFASLKEVKLFDECFVTATGWGICSVKSLNKKKFKEQKYTKQIQQSFSKHVELNIINQYLSFLK